MSGATFVVQALLSGMKSGVAAVIMSVVWDMFMGVVKLRDRVLLLVMAVSFVCNYFLHINVVFIILAVAALGVIRTLILSRKEGKT